MIISLSWILAASLLGFIIAAVFAGLLKLQRNLYLLVYIPLSLAFFICFLYIERINVVEVLAYNWYWGIAGAALASLFVMKNVLSQPPSDRNRGIFLVADILWPGAAYGLTDALMLSILPALAVRNSFPESYLAATGGKITFIIVAMAASILVTTAYHVGYPEFRGKKVLGPNIGNSVFTLAFLLTMNPLAAILPHIAMHITAMIHGRETTAQVPPHYDR